MLFHFWQSRAMVFYAKTVLGNPYLLNLHVKTYEALAEEAERQDVGNPMNLFLKYMGSAGGLYGYIDPMAWVIPYTLYRDAAVSFVGEKGLDKWTRRAGIFVNPMIAAAFTAVGWSDEFPAIIPTTSVQNIVKSVVDYDRNHGNILGRGAGITIDPITHAQRVAVDGLNNGVRFFAELVGLDVADVEVPDPRLGDKRQVKALIQENAEAEWGPQYGPDGELLWSPDQAIEVAQALAAVDSDSTGNARANEAYKTWSGGQIVEAGARMVIPGQTRVTSEYQDELRKDVNTAFDTEGVSPYDNPAVKTNEQLSKGSPESTILNAESEVYRNLGTARKKWLYESWNAIAYETLPGYSSEVIGGVTWYGYMVNKLSEDERRKLADVWALEQMDMPEDATPDDGIMPKNELDQYRDERKAYVEGSEELGDYYDYRDRVEEYPGGAAAWREYAAENSPEFAQEMDKQRQMFEDRGYVPSVVERRLDQWATSQDGYNAARNVRNKISDAEPLSGPSDIPMSRGEYQAGQQEILDAVKGQGGGGFNEEAGMPQFQLDLIDEWQRYNAAIQGFEAEYGPVANFQTKQGKASVAKYLEGQGFTEISNDLEKYLEWRYDELLANRDGSIEAYIAKLDADYKERKAKEKGADESAP
jgi:hypothetical protein